jgi:dipeptidyl aminopeptidase/acylaminoacyl peptidase
MITATPGSWKSPISPEMLAAAGVSLHFAQSFADELYWDESRPAQGGRTTVVSQTHGDVLATPWSAVSRVHEMGGLSWLVCTWQGAKGLLFAEQSDQRIYWQAENSAPVALTPENLPGEQARFSDFLIRHNEIWCVREVICGEATTRNLIAIDAANQIRILDSDSHFYAHLALSPDESKLAWISWEHPQMPWDGTQLRFANINSAGELEVTKVLGGGTNEAVNSPVWADEQNLYFISDLSGFWNVWSTTTAGDKRQVFQEAAEWAQPMWLVGTNTLRILPDGRLTAIHGDPANEAVVIADPETGLWHNLESDLTHFNYLCTSQNKIFAVGGGAKVAQAIVEFTLESSATNKIIREIEIPVELKYLPVAKAMAFPSENGRKVHAFVSPATNPDFASTDIPPVVITVHGGPTAHTTGVANIKRAFFTSRGFTVVDVNYGGSTGYGRNYRESLKGKWGVVDTEDILAVVAGLISQGLADPKKILIRGGSAGGFAVLNGLVHSKVFAAGANYYGVAELTMLAQDTHDFESRYLDSLVGPYPEQRDLYIQRSPLTYADNLTSPLIIFQGSDDPIVPPSQSLAFRDACIKNGVRHKYFEFAGESHGFKKSETIVTCAIEELEFFGEVLGFTPAP